MTDFIDIPYLYEAEVLLKGKRKAEVILMKDRLSVEIEDIEENRLNHVGSMLKRNLAPERGDTKYFSIDGKDGLYTFPEHKPYAKHKNWNYIEKRILEDIEHPMYYNPLTGTTRRRFYEFTENMTNVHTGMAEDATFISRMPGRYEEGMPVFDDQEMSIQKMISSEQDFVCNQLKNNLSGKLLAVDGVPLVETSGPFVNKFKAIFHTAHSKIYSMTQELNEDNMNNACLTVHHFGFGNIFPTILGEASMIKNGQGMDNYDFKAFSSEAFMTEGVHNFMDNYPFFALGHLARNNSTTFFASVNHLLVMKANELELMMEYLKTRKLMVEHKDSDIANHCIDIMQRVMEVTEDQELINNFQKNISNYEFFLQNVKPVYEKICDDNLSVSLEQAGVEYSQPVQALSL